jgi:integrase/recombinase XerC
MQISEAIEAFVLAKKANGRAPRTIKDYYRCLTPFAEWCQEQGLTADNLDRNDFRHYVAEELRSNGWAESTVSIYIRNLRCFLRWNYTEGYTDENIATAVEAPPQEVRMEDPLSIDEVNRLLGACQNSRHPDRDRALILVFLDTGLRRTEMANLKQDDIVFGEGNTAWMQLLDPKSKRWKFAFLGERTTKALHAYLSKREDDHPALWVGEKGALAGDGLYKIVKRRARDANLADRVHLHLFRKSFATWWIRSGGDTSRLKKLGGWATNETLDVYILLASRRDLGEAHKHFSPVDNILIE